MQVENLFETGWDCDGVLSASDIAVRKAIRSYGIHLVHSQLTHWNTVLAAAQALTNDQTLIDKINGKWFDPATLRRAPAYGFNLLAMRLTQRLKGGPSVITTRVPPCRQSSLDWLQEKANWFDPNRFYIRSDESIKGDPFKVGMAERLKVRFFVEDNAHTAIALSQAGIPVIMFPQPWNRSFDLTSYPNIRRVDNQIALLTVVTHRVLTLRKSLT